MADDPIEVLLRLRRMALDEANRALAICLQAETSAAAALRAIDESVERETDAASELSTDDGAVEAFAAWFRHARQRREAAIRTLSEAEAETAEARTVLVAARSAVRAVEELLARRHAEAQVREVREEQIRLDEAGSRRTRG